MTKLLLINNNADKITLSCRKVRGQDTYQVIAVLKENKTKFKTNKVHKAEATLKGIYYACNHAIGVLTNQQIDYKTNWKHGKKITCKNCIKKRYLR